MKIASIVSTQSIIYAITFFLLTAMPLSLLRAQDDLKFDYKAAVTLDSYAIMIVPPDVGGFTAMNVRIVDAAGLLMHSARSQGEAVAWDLPQDAVSGRYRYEVVVLIADAEAESGLSLHREYGAFAVHDGVIEQLGFTGRHWWEQAGDKLMLGAAKLLHTLIPAAHAASPGTFSDLLIEGPVPSIFFDNTDRTANDEEWQLDASQAAAASSSTTFRLLDLATDQTVFSFSPGADTANSLIVEDSGNIGFADGTLFLNKAAMRLGIGTTAPLANLQVNDIDPALRMHNEADDTFAEITYTGGNLFIDKGDAESNTAGDGLSQLLTLFSHNNAPGKGSDVGFSLINDVVGFNWNFRTFGGSEGFVATKQGTGGPEMEIKNATNDFRNVSISMGNNAQLTQGGVWQNASSREYKQDIEAIGSEEALAALSALKPVKYRYKRDTNKELNLGFIAEDVPELVATDGRKNMDPMEVVAMLTKVVQEQKKIMATQMQTITRLEQQMAEIRNEVRLQNMVSSTERFE